MSSNSVPLCGVRVFPMGGLILFFTVLAAWPPAAQPAAPPETPVGTVDGVNRTFTVPRLPQADQQIRLFRNGIPLQQDRDFNINGQVLTFTPSATPQRGDLINIVYRPLAVSRSAGSESSGFVQTDTDAKVVHDQVITLLAVIDSNTVSSGPAKQESVIGKVDLQESKDNLTRSVRGRLTPLRQVLDKSAQRRTARKNDKASSSASLFEKHDSSSEPHGPVAQVSKPARKNGSPVRGGEDGIAAHPPPGSRSLEALENRLSQLHGDVRPDASTRNPEGEVR